MAATPSIADKFRAVNPNVLDINNYPLPEEFEGAVSRPPTQDKPYVCHVGGLDKIRGILEIVQATSYLKNPVRLRLAGSFEVNFERQVKALPACNNVGYLDFLLRDGIRDILAKAGLVTLRPIPCGGKSSKAPNAACASIPSTPKPSHRP